MLETTRLVLNQFTDESISISLGVLIFVFAVLVTYWFYNRRKFRQLSHQIPASVVKNYLDTIINNSTALKSSLFRGGGLDLAEGVPSVIPTNSLPTGGVSVASGASSEELAQKNAEIAQLRATISEKDNTISELEKLLAAARDSSGDGISNAEADILRNEITDLKSQLEKAKQEASENAGKTSSDELDAVSKERDELKDRLMEYEIIEEDLANLKRFQQENEELKKTIEQLKAGGAAVAAAPEAAPEPAPEATPEPEPEPEPEPVAEATPAPIEEAPVESAPEEAAAEAPKEAASPEGEPEVPSNEGEQKSAEELLSEFEKMLG